MKYILSLLLILSSLSLRSQAILSDSDGMIYLNKNTGGADLEGKRGAYFGSHYFGDDIAEKYSKFMSYYISYEKDNVAYATEKMVVAKKPIYSAVKDLDKYFKKEAKKNKIPMEEAKERFEKVLDTAIKIRFYRTYEFEALLETAESDEEKEEIFNKVRIE